MPTSIPPTSQSAGPDTDTDYEDEWLSSPPYPEPVDPAEFEANQKWEEAHLERLKTARQKLDAMAASPTGTPELDTIFTNLQALKSPEAASAETGMEGLLASAQPQPEPVLGPQTFSKAADVEPDVPSANFIQAHIEGLPDEMKGTLLGVYSGAKQEGLSYQESVRRMLLHRDDLIHGGPGWPEFPNGAPTEKFWNGYLEGLSDQEQIAFRDMYDKGLKQGFRSKDSPPSSAWAEVEDNLKKSGLLDKGPLTPYEAFVALKDFEDAKYPQGRPAAKGTWGDVLLTALTAGPFGTAAVVGQGASMVANENLPEGTPESVRTAITFGLAGIGPGSIRQKALSATVFGTSAAAGQEAFQALGASGDIGALVAPILTPATAALARRQFSMLNKLPKAGQATEAQINAVAQRMPVDYVPDDIGRQVVVGDKLGTVSSLPDANLLGITTEDGLDLIVRRDAVVPMPGAGFRATVATEAERLRRGGRGVAEEELPLVVTEQAIADMPLGPTRVHFTPSENVEGIFKEGFRPTEAGPDDLPGVYTTGVDNPDFQKQASSYGKGFVVRDGKLVGRSTNPSAVYAEVPRGRIATEDEAWAHVDHWPGMSSEERADAMTRAVQRLQSNGFVGAQWRDGTVYFDATAVKPKLAAGLGREWDDFITFAKGVANGDTRVMMTQTVGGGALPGPGFSRELNQLATAITNNHHDYSMLWMALSKAAQPKNLPASNWGALRLYARRAVGMNPGLIRKSQPAFLAASNYDSFQQMQTAIRLATLEKGVKEAFGAQFVGNAASPHLLSQYKGPALTGKPSDYIVGTLADAIDRPGMYNLTSNQKDVIDLWQSVLRHDAQVTESLGIDYALIEREYVPYKRVDPTQSFQEKLFSTASKGTGLGGKARPFFLKERKSQTLADWAEHLASVGEQAELDPFKLYLNRLSGTNKLRADQVFLNGIGLAYGKTLAKGDTVPPGWTEIGIGRLKTRTAVPDDIAREVNAAMSPAPVGDLVARAETAVQTMRSTLLSMDGSFLTQQGYALAVTDPVRYFKRFGDAALVASSNEGFILHLAQNLDAYSRFAQAGGTIFTTATDVVRSLDNKQFVDKIPIAGQLNEFGYGRFLPIMKMQQWTAMNQMLLNIQGDKTLLQQVFAHTPFVGLKANEALRKFAGVEGMSSEQILEASADTVNNIGGGINWAKLMTSPSLASQLVFLTEGWLRANVGRIVNTAKFGDPAGVLARRWMIQNLAMSSLLSTSMSLMLSGRLPNYDPTAGDFLDIQVGPNDEAGKGGTIPILPGKTYIRQIFQSILGRDVMTEGVGLPWEEGEAEERVNGFFRFAEGRVGQLPRLGMDLTEGRDYLGRKIDDKLLYSAKSFMPIAMQYVMDGFGAGGSPTESVSLPGAGLAIAGLNFIPRNPYDVRDQKVSQLGLVDPITKSKLDDYSHLSDIQRAQFDRENPEYSAKVHQWQEERDSPFVALRAIRQEHRFAVDAIGKAFQGQELTLAERNALGPEGANLDLKNNPRRYRQLLSSLAVHYRNKAEKEGIQSGKQNPEPLTASQEVVQGYYKEVIDSSIVAGQVDFTIQEANDRAYRRKVKEKYGDEGLRVLDEELVFRVSDDPVAQAYHKDSTLWEPYFNHLDSFWTPKNLESAGFSPQSAETAGKFPNREQYEAWLTSSYIDAIYGDYRGVLPDRLADYRTGRGQPTIGEKFGIVPGRRLTEQQAQEVSEELVRIQLKSYRDRVGEASNQWLKKNTEALCAMSYWDIVEPSEAVRPYLNLCQVRRVP